MPHDGSKTDRLFQVTRQALNTASLRANQYKQVVQKKIDLGAIHKKIEQLHTELGKQIDDLYEAETQDLLADPEASRLLEKLVSLKQAAALLEEEIELIRNEPMAERAEQQNTKSGTAPAPPPEAKP